MSNLQIGVTSTLTELATLSRFDTSLVGVVKPELEAVETAEVAEVGVGGVCSGTMIVGVGGVGVTSISRDWECVTTVWWGRIWGSDI